MPCKGRFLGLTPPPPTPYPTPSKLFKVPKKCIWYTLLVALTHSPISLSPFPKLLTTNFKVTTTSTLTIKAKDAKVKNTYVSKIYKQEKRQTNLAQEPGGEGYPH